MILLSLRLMNLNLYFQYNKNVYCGNEKYQIIDDFDCIFLLNVLLLISDEQCAGNNTFYIVSMFSCLSRYKTHINELIIMMGFAYKCNLILTLR